MFTGAQQQTSNEIRKSCQAAVEISCLFDDNFFFSHKTYKNIALYTLKKTHLKVKVTLLTKYLVSEIYTLNKMEQTV